MLHGHNTEAIRMCFMIDHIAMIDCESEKSESGARLNFGR